MYLLVQQLLCLVHLGRKVRAAASIGMVEKHNGAVGFADLVLGECSLAAKGKATVSKPNPPQNSTRAMTIRLT